MYRAGVVGLFLAIGLTTTAFGQQLTDSWLRLAASACGGGLSFEAQGEIEADLLKRLKIITGSVEATGSYDLTDVQRLLKEFDGAGKSSSYTNYMTCLLTLTNQAVDSSGLPPKEVKLDTPIEIQPLQIVKRGQKFVLKVGESAAIGNVSRIVSVHATFKAGIKGLFVWSDTQIGLYKQDSVRTGEPIIFAKDCMVTPYHINGETGLVSLVSNC